MKKFVFVLAGNQIDACVYIITSRFLINHKT